MKIITGLLLLVCVCFSITSNSQPPFIISFNPQAGYAGTTITINGNNFAPIPADNLVFFGAVRATVTVASTSQLSVIVPAGAMFRPISITVNNLICYTSQPFLPTFPAGAELLTNGSFTTGVSVATGVAPYSTAIGDLNYDGKAEIVVTNHNSNTVSVFKNTSSNGTISFGSKTDFNTSTLPYGVAIADINLDGKLDIIVTNGNVATVSVLINTSSSSIISFAPKVDFATGAASIALAVHDIDGDGKPDIIVLNRVSNRFSILHNNSSPGSLSFEPNIDFSTVNSPWDITITDIDNDGVPDVVLSLESVRKVSVFRNTSSPGIISFNANVDIPTGQTPRGIVSGDMDGDGKVDLITANHLPTSISVLRNTSTSGNISFDSQIEFQSSPPVGLTERVSIGDLNGDGKPDLAAVSSYTSTMTVFENKSTNGVIVLGTRIMFNMPLTPQDVCIADLDGDGKPDIAAVSKGANKVTYFRNIPPPKIASFAPLSGTVGTSVIISGYNFRLNPLENFVFFGASRAHVTSASNTSLTVEVPIGATYKSLSVTTDRMTAYSTLPFIVNFTNGISTLDNSYAAKFEVGTYQNSNGIAVADFTGDGRVDIAVTSEIQKNVSILSNESVPGNPSMQFGDELVLSLTPKALTAGDFDGDGRPDIAVAGSSNSVDIFQNTAPYTIFSFITTLSILYTEGSLYIHDLNGDGKPELIVCSLIISIFPNTSVNGNITFGPRLDFNSPDPYLKSIIGDFDGDGKTDIIFGKSFLKNISGNGIISFATPISYTTGNNSDYLATGDLNGDGKLDIGAINTATNKVVTFLNTSSAGILSFVSQQDYTTGYYPKSIAISDLNGDNKLDLAVADRGYNAISVFTNISTGNNLTFMQKVDYATGKVPAGIDIVDIDGDGKNDIVVPNYSSNSISILRYNIFTPLLSVPTISSFSPLNGQIGTSVVIAGTNFGSSVTDNTVYFGAVKAEIQTATSNTLTVKVPAGATFQPISVTNNNSLTAYSSQPFVVTFAGGGAPFTNNSFEAYIDFPTGWSPYNISINDLDGDGKSDLVVVNRNDNSISVLRNTCAGKIISFAPKIDYPVGISPFQVKAGDLDGDGKLDLVITNSEAQTFTVYRNTSIIGTISLATPLTFYTDAHLYRSPTGVGIRDFDGDGKPDVVIANNRSNMITFFRNITIGPTIAFAPEVVLETLSSDLRALTIDDFDANGKPDIMCTSQVSVFSNLSLPGSIAFTALTIYPGGTTLASLASGDLNSDGKSDVVITGSGIGFSVLRNQSIRGTTSFIPEGSFGVMSYTAHMVVINDINGDGKPDVALPNLYTSGVSLFRNKTGTGAISFSPQFTYVHSNPPGNSVSASVGDIDGDGKSDVVVIYLNNIAVLRNKIGEPFRICSGENTLLESNISGQAFHWQLSTDSVNFSNISDNTFYTGTNTQNLQLNNVPSSFSGYQFRCVSSSETSEIFIVRFGDTWTGAMNDQWENPANWNCGSIPDMYTDVTINAGASIVLNSNATIATLTLNTGATLNVNNGFNLTITGR